MIKETQFKNFNGDTIKEFSGRAWMGTYDGGELGFCCSEFSGHNPVGLGTAQREMMSGKGWYPSDLYRVEVIVKLVLNNKKQPIIKRNKNRKSQS